jgi:hypothetical protein
VAALVLVVVGLVIFSPSSPSPTKVATTVPPVTVAPTTTTTTLAPGAVESQGGTGPVTQGTANFSTSLVPTSAPPITTAKTGPGSN